MLFGKYASRRSEARYPSLWDGLVGAWCPSIQSPSGTRLYDLSGRNSHGVFTGLTPAAWTKISGNTITTTQGAANRIEVTSGGSIVPSHLAINNFSAWSFSAWVYPTVATVNFPTLISWGRFGASLGLQATTQKIEHWRNNSSNVLSTGSVSLNQWTHVGVSQVGSTVSLWLNGRLDSSTSAAAITTAYITGFTLMGTTGSNINASFGGAIDSIYTHSRALNASEWRILASSRLAMFRLRASVARDTKTTVRRNYPQIFGIGVIG